MEIEASPWLRDLVWMHGPDAAGPELQMARDELLLASAYPVLRVYRWDCPAATLGFFTPWQEASAALTGRAWTRRMTGGGLVLHDTDWTYSIVVPRSEVPTGWTAKECYAAVHHALALALGDHGVRSYQGGCGMAGAPCFERPVPEDLVDVNGIKIAGAALRFTRGHVLVQGSVRPGPASAFSPARFASALAKHARPATDADFSLFHDASRLAEFKYKTQAWKKRC